MHIQLSTMCTLGNAVYLELIIPGGVGGAGGGRGECSAPRRGSTAHNNTGHPLS